MALTVSPLIASAASTDNHGLHRTTDYRSTTSLLRQACDEANGDIAKAIHILNGLAHDHCNARSAISVLRVKSKKHPGVGAFVVESNGFVSVSKRPAPEALPIPLPAPRAVPITETYRAQAAPTAIDRARAFAEAAKSGATRPQQRRCARGSTPPALRPVRRFVPSAFAAHSRSGALTAAMSQISSRL
jgi:hypothetical protein